jgi:hypothetical protein
MIIQMTPLQSSHFQSMLERINSHAPQSYRTVAAEISDDPSAYIIEGDFKDVTPSTKER